MIGRRGWMSMALLLAVSCTGCGSGDAPPLGAVSGTVTLDGDPLEGVIVVFKPTEGRPAVGTSDAEGKYSLEYAYKVSGCKVGANKVSFEWPLGATNAKALSTKYTTQSELTEEVADGSNTIDFDLETEGKGKAKKLVIPD